MSRRLSFPSAPWTPLLAGAALAAAISGAAPAGAATVVVGPGDLLPTPGPGGWWFFDESVDANPHFTGSMVSGPATPPLGQGSARMALDASSAARGLLGTVDFAGTRLDALTALSYGSRRASADAGNLLSVALQIDFDCDLTDTDTTWQGRAVFEPYFTAGSGTILQNTWYTWNPLAPAAKWWLSGTPRKGNVPFTNPCPQAAPCTLATLLSAPVCPDAGVRNALAQPGAVQFRAGGPWPSFDGNVDAFTIGVSGNSTTYDFEPCADRWVDPTGSDAANDCTNAASPCATIQHAIDVTCPGDTVHVRPGSYDETAPVPTPPACPGDTVGLYFPAAKAGVTVQGVDALDAPITSAAGVLATVTTNSNLCFGPDGILVEADDVTIAGIRIGANDPLYGQNKTIEVLGDGFVLKHSDVADLYGSVYLNAYDDSSVQAYRIEGNVFQDGVSLDISNGAGFMGPVANRVITGNTFYNLATTAGTQAWPSISFNGSGTGVPWFVHSVGGAVITGNVFSSSAPDGQHIRARGTYDDSQFDWNAYFTANTFNRSVVFGSALPATLGTFSYTSGPYTFSDVRRIGASIQGELDHAQDGDTVLVGPGSYDESPSVATSVLLTSAAGRALTTINLQTGPTYLGALTIGGDDVTVEGFTIVGRDGTPSTIAASNILVNGGVDTVTIRDNRLRIGNVDGATSNGDDGIGVLTTYAVSPPFVASVDVSDNVIEPLNATGFRAFYVNPGVTSATVARNQITGRFAATAITQAQTGMVEDNVVDGLGLGGAGIASWGYPDADVWGQTSFTGNVLRGLFAGITVFESNATVISCNQFVDNDYGVRIRDGFGAANFDPTTVSIVTNSFVSSATAGVANVATTPGVVPANPGNWWGCVAGPGNPGCDAVTGSVDFTPFAATVPACASCASNAECSDGLACTGAETCVAGSCVAGTPTDCSGLDDQCNTGVCVEPAGTCAASPLPDGTTCESGGDTCSLADGCVAGACPNNGGGGDPDGDDLCSADDNCPSDANPSQSNIDNEDGGDVCDPQEGTLNVTRAKLKAGTGSGSDASNFSLKGDFLVTLPGDAFSATNGIALTMTDNLGQSRTMTFAPADCKVSATRIACTTPDRRSKASFSTKASAAGLWKFTAKSKKQMLTAPFDGPVSATLTYGAAIDRNDQISDCVSRFTTLTCREF